MNTGINTIEKLLWHNKLLNSSRGMSRSTYNFMKSFQLFFKCIDHAAIKNGL